MIDFDICIKNSQSSNYNVFLCKKFKFTDNYFLEIRLINKSYIWLRTALSISKLPYLILGFCKFVVIIKLIDCRDES
jgi:hypothetical protein